MTYVSYRNLKNFLLFVRGSETGQGDYELHKFDQWLLFGHDPAVVLHSLLGTTFSAHVLSWVYLIFLPMVPVSVIVWLVWSRNVSFGYWFVTAQCIALDARHRELLHDPDDGPELRLGVALRGPARHGGQVAPGLLVDGRHRRLPGLSDGVQSVAGFASLHVAITLLMALVAQYTVRHRFIKVILWVYMGITVLSTTYFGWHYIADDIAGAIIAFIAFYIGGIATGQKFDEHGRHSHPTTTTSDVPVEREDNAQISG